MKQNEHIQYGRNAEEADFLTYLLKMEIDKSEKYPKYKKIAERTTRLRENGTMPEGRARRRLARASIRTLRGKNNV